MKTCPECGLGYGNWGCRCHITINDPEYYELEEEEKTKDSEDDEQKEEESRVARADQPHESI